ncbi:pentapeptide repeat-containing protein [Pseudanabaena biceps]|nr:pentapeptide repeat-containing protein [Pseudanabaena biceps]
MASNKNNQQKGSGANEPHEDKSIASDASDVDWMIMSDLSTRIGGYPQPQKSASSPSNQSPSKSSSQQMNDDLEDLEWLQSIGLDSPIDRKPTVSTKVANQASNNVENIDWLIVTDLKTRMDDSDIQARAKSKDAAPLNTVLQPQLDSLENIDLDDDLGLNGLEFLEDSEFSGIDDLGFDTSDEFDAGDLLGDAIDSDDNSSLELDNFLEENFNLDNLDNLESNSDNNDWDAIADTNESLTGFQVEQKVLITDPESDYEIDLADQDLITSDEIANISLEESVEEELLDLAESPNVQDLADFSDDLTPEIDSFTDEFLEAQPLESLDSNVGDEVWASPEISNSDLINHSNNDVFANDWEQALSADSEKVSDNDLGMDDDSIWGVESVEAAAAAIENAFGQEEQGAIASSSEDLTSFEYVEQAADSEKLVYGETDWGSDLEAEIDSNNQLTDQSYEDQALTDSEQYLEPLVSNVENFDEQYLNPSSNADYLASKEEFPEEYLNINLASGIEEDPNDFSWQPSQSDDGNLGDDFNATFDGQSDISESALPIDTSEFNNPSFLSEPLQDRSESNPSSLIANLSNFEEDFNDFNDFNADFAAAIDEQISGFGIVSEPIETMLKPKSITYESEASSPDRNSSYGLGNIIDEDFDLADFDEDSLIDAPVLDLNNSTATSLTPVRPSSSPDFIDQDINEEAERFSAPISEDDNFNDEFEKAIAYERMNKEQFPELGLIEDSLGNKLLGGNAVVDFAPTPPIAPPNLPIPANIGDSAINNYAIAGSADSSDHDFLDEFDLDSIGSDILGDDFDSGFVSPRITTGLNISTPPTLPPMPTSPPVSIQPPTQPNLNNPPPPPFLPPLPPKRSHAPQPQHPPMTTSSSSGGKPYASNTQSSPLSRGSSSLDDPSFDDFHNNSSDQSRGRKSLTPIDEGWSDLLDADTVLSDVLQPNVSSPSRGISSIDSSASRNNSQGRDIAPSRQRKQNKIPDFDDLGLEIHDETNDWSGLLDGNDRSDNITSVTTSTQLPTRSRDYRANRSTDVTGLSAGSNETQEIPRDRRQPSPRFNEPSPSRIPSIDDPMDFNRFTEENYDHYNSSENLPEPAPAPSRPKITIPSFNLESLWENYLKIPAMGVGAIGVAVLLYSLASKPIFDIGLRWGIFKDASGKDFTNADFRGAKLDNVDFSKSILTGAKMQEASMVGANFSEANLDGVNFTKANLNKARLIKASVVWAEFSDAQMNLVDFAEADLSRSNFGTAKLDGSNLKGAKIGEQGTEKAAKFNSVTLLAWQIVNDPREGRNLSDQNLSGLNLSFTSLKRANLTNAKLNFADLTGTDLSGANLSSGQLDGANLSGAKLSGINLTGVKFDKNKLPKTDEETTCPNSKKGPCKF